MNTHLNSAKLIKKEHNGALILSKVVLLAFAATVYTIWRFRNQILFNGVAVSTDFIFNSIRSFVYFVLFSIYPLDVIKF